MIERVRPKRKRKRREKKTFTELWLERKRPPKTGQVTLWDGGDKGQVGLSVLVSAGGTKTYRSTFYLHGRPVSRKLGRVGEISLGDARDMTRADRGLASKGIDPRTQPYEEVKFKKVLADYIELEVRPNLRTWKQVDGGLRRECGDWFNKRIAHITQRDVYKLLDGMVANGERNKARLTCSYLRGMWRWAAERKYVARPSFMEDVKVRFNRVKRTRFFDDDEVKAIWNAADALDLIQGGYLKLLILLAPRKSELAGMRRSEFDDADKPTLWTTPFERTKSRMNSDERVYLTPLPPLAQRIIMSLPKRDDDLLFPGRIDRTTIHPGQKLKKRLVELGAPEDFTYHAMRHTMGTWLENEGHDEFETGLVLNHSGGVSISSNYRHGFAGKLKLELLTKWADHVEGLVTPKGVARLR